VTWKKHLGCIDGSPNWWNLPLGSRLCRCSPNG